MSRNKQEGRYAGCVNGKHARNHGAAKPLAFMHPYRENWWSSSRKAYKRYCMMHKRLIKAIETNDIVV